MERAKARPKADASIIMGEFRLRRGAYRCCRGVARQVAHRVRARQCELERVTILAEGTGARRQLAFVEEHGDDLRELVRAVVVLHT